MRKNNPRPFPQLHTERLVLRKLVLDDAADLLALRSNEIVNRYLDRPPTKTLENALEIIRHLDEGIRKKDWHYWAIALKDNSRLIGTVCLWNLALDKAQGEIGYELLPEFHGRGIMQEAVGRVIAFATGTLHLNTLFAWTEGENEASIRLLERLGFQRDGAEEIAYGNQQGIGNMVIYALRKKT